MKSMKLTLLLILAVATFTGCSSYNSLIGHPLHVLHEQHHYNEQQKEAKKLGEAMYKDTHPQK